MREKLLPVWLKRSAEVDLRQLMANIRPAMRTELAGSVDAATLARWRRRLGLYAVLDEENFIALSRSAARARRLLVVDRAPGRHEQRLGHALGYPPCCIRAAARVGEEGLDAWAARAAARRRCGHFVSLDVRAYAAGKAALSHIPCGPACAASLAMARALQTRDPQAWRPHARRTGGP